MIALKNLLKPFFSISSLLAIILSFLKEDQQNSPEGFNKLFLARFTEISKK